MVFCCFRANVLRRIVRKRIVLHAKFSGQECDMRKREHRNIFNLQSAKRIIHKVNEIMANENNRHHSEALPLLLRPDASGAGSGGKRLG